MIAELIETVRSRGSDVERAERRLIELGAAAMPALLEAIEKSQPVEARLLTNVIRKSSDPAVVPYLVQALGRRELRPVHGAALAVMGRLGGPGVLEHLLGMMEHRFLWASAVGPLAELGRSEAIPVLEAKLTELVGDSDDPACVAAVAEEQLDAIGDLIVARARFGCFDRARLVEGLVNDSRFDRYARHRSAQAMRVAVTPTTLPFALATMRDPEPLVRLAMVDVLYLLGLPETVEPLIAMTEDPFEETAERARFRLRDLTGTAEVDEARAIAFVPRACHRDGRPIDYVALARLASRKSREPHIAGEMHERTGSFVGVQQAPLDPGDPAEVERAGDEWIATRSHAFAPGGHYRFGFPVRVFP